MAFSALFLDFDRTLHDFEATNRRALKATFETMLRPDPHRLGSLIAAYQEAAQGLYDLYEEGRLTLEEMHRARMIYALRATDLHVEEAALDELIAVHQQVFLDSLVVYPEAEDVLAHLCQTWPLYLLSNGPEGVQRRRIQASGLAAYFRDLVISGEVGFAKPHPAYFQVALEKAGAAPHDALMVGDSPRHDIEGARSCGIAALWLNRQGQRWPLAPPQPPQVRHLRQLVAWLEAEDGS